MQSYIHFVVYIKKGHPKVARGLLQHASSLKCGRDKTVDGNSGLTLFFNFFNFYPLVEALRTLIWV